MEIEDGERIQQNAHEFLRKGGFSLASANLPISV
jgi:hypothetical protein